MKLCDNCGDQIPGERYEIDVVGREIPLDLCATCGIANLGSLIGNGQSLHPDLFEKGEPVASSF